VAEKILLSHKILLGSGCRSWQRWTLTRDWTIASWTSARWPIKQYIVWRLECASCSATHWRILDLSKSTPLRSSLVCYKMIF